METPRLPTRRASSDLSYKFQRLREKIRQAVVSGELKGKLPGERELARRFRVNAKTLSKALTDLAAEGLLERSIGRGTFVKGSGPQTNGRGRWLIVCDDPSPMARVIDVLSQHNPQAQVVSDTRQVRPSFLNQFDMVIDLGQRTVDTFLRDVVVRNMSLITVGGSRRTYSTSSVEIDVRYAAGCLARELMLAGHLRFAAVEAQGQTVIADSLRAAARRYSPKSTVDVCFANDLACVVDLGISAVVCDSQASARSACQVLAAANLAVPDRVSVAAIGHCDAPYECSGYFVSSEQLAGSILEVAANAQATKPLTLWLATHEVDEGTIAPVRDRGADGGGVADLRFSSLAG